MLQTGIFLVLMLKIDYFSVFYFSALFGGEGELKYLCTEIKKLESI